jgi:hypothetical protein
MESKILKDRLYRGKASPKCLAAMGGAAPDFPFSFSDVKKSRVQTTVRTNQQQTAQQNYDKQESYQSNTSSSSYNQQGYASAAAATSAGQVAQQVSSLYRSRQGNI